MELMTKGSLRSLLSDSTKCLEIMSDRAIQFHILRGIVNGTLEE